MPTENKRRSEPEPKRSGSERQARSRRRKPRPPKLKPALSSAGGTVREVGRRFNTPGTRRLARTAAGLLSRVWHRLLYLIFSLAAGIERLTAAAVGRVGPRSRRAVAAADRLFTPSRALALTVVAATAMLILAQFTDYRGIGIGQAQYSEVTAITSAPLAETETPWQVHGPVLILLGLIAAGGSLLALRLTGPRAARARAAAALAAMAGLAVILLVDLPAANQVGVIAEQYAETQPVLLKGFYAELGAISILALATALPAIWRLRLPTTGLPRRPRPARAGKVA